MVADALGIWRNDASVELNRLVSEGRIVKSGKKNILYSLPESRHEEPSAAPADCKEAVSVNNVEGTSFSKLVGANGSLKQQITVAKAAVSYPPHGLHMLILGPTGVGKTVFAYSVWEYAKEIGAFGHTDGNIPFVHFNCTEYADNPQLLLSHLFGHKKGAFTDATSDRVGLVEEANGGIFFMDEIHGLSATGQELLFTLLDTGYYRRLGDTVSRESHFMLIGATTVSISDSLVDAFVRRIPIVTQIPSLAERPSSEIREFIACFFQQEADRVSQNIHVKRKVLNSLVDYAATSNLGSLKNTIQISCAKARLKSIIGRNSASDSFIVTSSDLTLKRLTLDNTDQASAERKQLYSSDLHITAGQHWHPAEESKEPESIYSFVDRLVSKCYQMNLDDDEILCTVSTQLDEYCIGLRERIDSKSYNPEIVNGMCLPGTWQAAWDLLGEATKELGVIYTPNAALFLAMHLSQYINKSLEGEFVFPLELNRIVSKDNQELRFLQEHKEWLEKKIGCAISRDELRLIFLILEQLKNAQEAPSVWLTLISRDHAIADAMGKFVTDLYCFNNISIVHNDRGYSSAQIMSALCNELKMHHGKNGNVILTDIKILASEENELIRKTGVDCRIIPVMEQNLLMAACKASQNFDTNPDEVYAYAMNAFVGGINRIMEDSGINQQPVAAQAESGEVIVLVTCSSGIGSARGIRNILVQRLAYIPNIKIVTASSFDSGAQLKKLYGGRIKLIVGTVDLKIPGVPFISASRVFTHDGMLTIYAMLDNVSNFMGERDKDSGDSVMQSLLDNFILIAPNINKEAAVTGIAAFIDRLEAHAYGSAFTEDVRAHIFMHCTYMFERIAKNEDLEISGTEELRISERQAWFERLSSIAAESFVGLPAVPRGELYYLMASLPSEHSIA